MNAALQSNLKLGQRQQLSARQLQGIALLAKSLPALRAAIVARMAANPAIEDIDHPLETPLSEVEAKHDEQVERDTPDYPEDDFTPSLSPDEDAAERRQRFFDNQIKTETLQQHLVAQLPLSDIPVADRPLAVTLIDDLNDDGFYKGSVPDVCMAFGKKPAEVEAVRRQLMTLDPLGCGALTAQESLLAQLAPLKRSPRARAVREMILHHFADMAAGRHEKVREALKLTEAEYAAARSALLALEPHPGRRFPGARDRVEYLNPEVHAVKLDGRWYALTDRRSLPEIKISGSFAELLNRADTDRATKLYIRGKIDEAEALKESVAYRQDTLESVAQAVFDRQQDFFEKGFAALHPLTEAEIARELKLDLSTVSRTVKDKYVALPKGRPVELRRFFAVGVKSADGASVARPAVLARLRAIVEGEDRAHPFSDQRLSAEMKAAGYPAARRTIAKYRGLEGIPDAEARRRAYAREAAASR